MTKHLTPDEFGALFASVRRSAWRWECQPHYAVDNAELAAWREGRPAEETAEDRAWETYVRSLRAAGIPFERVRAINDPPTTYQRWVHTTADRSVDIGEDVRWLTAATARDLALPGHDFYLIDNDRVAVLDFEEDGELAGIDIHDAPALVAAHQAWRDRAWTAAIPHRLYAVAGGYREATS